MLKSLLGRLSVRMLFVRQLMPLIFDVLIFLWASVIIVLDALSVAIWFGVIRWVRLVATALGLVFMLSSCRLGRRRGSRQVVEPVVAWVWRDCSMSLVRLRAQVDDTLVDVIGASCGRRILG